METREKNGKKLPAVFVFFELQRKKRAEPDGVSGPARGIAVQIITLL